MADLGAQKSATRKIAFATRKAAHAAGGDATANVVETLARYSGKTIAGYWPIRTEIDPRPALEILSRTHQVVLPVVDGEAQPLSFRTWTPGCEMIEGAFGAAIPANLAGRDPDILIVPLLAFDAHGFRLGYGGGFYDRTLEKLKLLRPTHAVGFAYAAQEIPTVPTEPTDQRLDAIVTETGTQIF